MTTVSGLDALLSRFFEFRLVRNGVPSHEGPTVATIPDASDCELAILEFDDQGLCLARQAMKELTAALQRLDGRNPIILVFAHGWKHNAASSDDNLEHFTNLLRQTATTEQTQGGKRPVLGVYAAWRGLSRYGNWFWTQFSFWDRQSAAERVALGSARELLGRLKAFRNGPAGADGKARATLVVIGHSFGGLLVYKAVAQSLIEAAATQEKVVPSFGDLVLLVNPAFSAVSYLPIHEIIKQATFDADLLPVCVSVTAKKDWATGLAYPAGALGSLITEAWRDREERQALINTMGHLSWMRTHEIAKAAPSAETRLTAGADRPPQGATLRALSTHDRQATFGQVTVRRLPNLPPSPFWVASATPDVVGGHNGIFTPEFIGFVRDLVTAHITKAR